MWHFTRVPKPGFGRPTAASALQRVRRLLAERLSPELQREAIEDPLTGALNKRADQAVTARALADRRPGTRVLRLRADLDNFKALNDHRGHQAGDDALCVVRRALEHGTRDVDVVSLARPGGDEFALTLRVAADADPTAIRDRIEDTVNRVLVRVGLGKAGGRRVGISIGVVAVTGAITAEALDAAADAAALERKKTRGISRSRQTSGKARVTAA